MNDKSGVYGLLASANNAKAANEYQFTIEGDLYQMSAQGTFLRERGFDVQQRNVYPVLKEKDKKAALQMIWDSKVEGWWHYKDSMVKFEICTADEWGSELTIQCEVKK